MLVKPFKSCKPANAESKKVQKWQKVALMGSWIRGSNYLQAPRSAVESNESYAIQSSTGDIRLSMRKTLGDVARASLKRREILTSADVTLIV